MSTLTANEGLDRDLIARLVQQIAKGRHMPMPVCIDGKPFGRTDRHIFAAATQAGFDASFALVLKGPLSAEQEASLQDVEESRWATLHAFAGGGTEEDH
ncbi:MAG: hypothetical protein WEE66_07875 [Actinomycetota bacterium]